MLGNLNARKNITPIINTYLPFNFSMSSNVKGEINVCKFVSRKNDNGFILGYSYLHIYVTKSAV
jgi:hypothetical protein